MKVAILGAGAIGFTTAIILGEMGHDPILWSPSGKRTALLARGNPLQASGVLSCSRAVGVADSLAEAIAASDAVLVAVDAAGHKPVLEAAAKYLRDGQPVIISAAYAMSALHLSRALKAAGVRLPIVSWSATIGTAQQDSLTDVTIRMVRPTIDAAAFGERQPGEGLEICRALFGDRFRPRGSALEIALLANSNPVFHVPVTLMNLTRVEQKETWFTYERTTEGVSRLIDALDAERLGIAAACGFSVQTVNEHFHHSFGEPLGSMATMMSSLFQAGIRPKGATSVEHRHITQDIPFGLVFASEVGRLVDVATPLHDAVIALASTALGRDFRTPSPLKDLLNCEHLTKADIIRIAQDGY